MPTNIAFKRKFERAQLKVDTDSLKRSRRCNKSVYDFITGQIGIDIQAHEERTTIVRVETDPPAVAAFYRDPGIGKLFYQDSRVG